MLHDRLPKSIDKSKGLLLMAVVWHSLLNPSMFPHKKRWSASTKLVTSDRWLTHIPENETVCVQLDLSKLKDKSATQEDNIVGQWAEELLNHWVGTTGFTVCTEVSVLSVEMIL